MYLPATYILHLLDSCTFSYWTGPYTYYVCFLKEGEGGGGLGVFAGICLTSPSIIKETPANTPPPSSMVTTH